jgi:hypothetical protein
MSNLWVTPEELGAYATSEFAYEAAKAASGILWSLSGRKYSGVTTVTERYVCAFRSYTLGASSRTHNALLLDGDIYNIPEHEFDDFAELVSDGLSPESRIKLRGRPVTKVHAIRTRNGAIIPPDQYYLVDHSTIQARAGVPWTPCNTEITYSYGTYPPTLGKMAARTLAIELAKLWAGDETCALPERVTSITRQGVTYTVLDNQDFIDDLKTGIYTIDLFLKSTNPDRARAKARVFTPDVPRGRRSTPKQFELGVSNLDITVYGDDNGTITVPSGYMNAEFLIDDGNWVPTVTIRSYGGGKSLELDQGAVSLNDQDDTVTVNVTYADALTILGMVDPGTWDLYASRPSVSAPGGTETVYIASGNLQISMAKSSINGFTIGASGVL